MRHSFVKDSRGNVAMLFALTLVIIVGLGGGAIDFGRCLSAREQAQNAIDAALLAGGRVLQSSGGDGAAAVLAAQRSYDQMKPHGLSLDTIRFDVVDNRTGVQAVGTALIETPFLGVLGISEVAVSAEGKAVVAGGGNASSNQEISLMLDVTGSMRGQKIDAMKLAAKDLIDIVIWDDQSKYTSKVALVPFSDGVRTGPMTAQVAIDAPDSARVGDDGDTDEGDDEDDDDDEEGDGDYLRATDCVSERTGPEAFTDAGPNVVKVGRVYTKDGTCEPPDLVVPLSSDKTMLKSVIDKFVAVGSTAGHLGTAWAWYMLSPNWGDVFGPDSRPAPYGAEKLRKIAVLMTDGEYNTEYDGGVKTSTTGGRSPNGTSIEQTRQLCANMKAAGITVYSVVFQLTKQTAVDLLSTCATSPEHFYNATTGDELRLSFRDIALKISTLRLVE